MKFIWIIAAALLLGAAWTPLPAQDFYCALEKIEIAGFNGLQSAAVGQTDGHLVLLGGRTDGLHQRQPFAAFLPDGSNPGIIVLSPTDGGYWSAPIAALPTVQREQLLASNLQFCQEGPWLYLVGGYGFSPSADDHVTHPLLTVVRLDSLVAAVQAGAPVAPWFRSVTDEAFAVSGGQMVRQGNVFYLAGGHRFEGRYNPMNHPTFVQEYTNAIRRFQVFDDGAALSVAHQPAWTDAVGLHRRDYNLVPQVFPNGKSGFTMFSGVFQQFADLPYLNSVDFDSSGFAVNNTFEHRLNQYHCSHAALYDSVAARMHTVFFGGIAQFYFDQNNVLQQDDEVPFVRTIGRVSRQADGTATEQKIGEMPGLLGAGAEFVPLPGLPFFDGTDIIRLDQLSADSTLIGYIAGGIESDLPNVFFDDPATQSQAHPALYAIYLVKSAAPVGIAMPPAASPLASAALSPNPAHDTVELQFTLGQRAPTGVLLQAPGGQTIVAEDLGVLEAGAHRFQFRLRNFPAGIYPVTLYTGQFLETLQLVIVR